MADAARAHRSATSTPTTSGPLLTSSSPTAPRSESSDGRSRAAGHRRRSPPRSPGCRRRAICRAQRRHGHGGGLARRPPTTTSARSRAGRSPPPARSSPIRTSSGCPRTPTRTRRSSTTSATAGRCRSARGHRRRLPRAARLGILPVDDPDVADSIAVVDAMIAHDTASGPGLHRYNGDGYGDRGQRRPAVGAERARGPATCGPCSPPSAASMRSQTGDAAARGVAARRHVTLRFRRRPDP